MANQTPNYGLHQWEPSDNFLRTDFNTDFQKIDTALGQKAEQSTVTGLEQTVQQKIRMATGSYQGDHGFRTVELGFRPQAVILIASDYAMMALEGESNNGLTITDYGFTAQYVSGDALCPNNKYSFYRYTALG